MDNSTLCTPTIDRQAVACAVLANVARRLQLPAPQVEQAFALTTWTTIDEMIEREFVGAYRRYFPKCGMEGRHDAVIAEIFDQIAIALDDPRRAMRSGAWTPPGGWSGGAHNG